MSCDLVVLADPAGHSTVSTLTFKMGDASRISGLLMTVQFDERGTHPPELSSEKWNEIRDVGGWRISLGLC
jgi:hypothetical protein